MTCQKIYELALALMNMSKDDADYEDATVLGMLQVMANEVLDVSDSIKACEGNTSALAALTDLQDDLPLADKVCTSVLPYGLAAHLLLDENPDVAAFFNQRYAELLSEYRRGIPAASEDIQDLYGGIEYGQFARWD